MGHEMLGDLLMGQHKLEEAAAEYREAIRIDPHDTLAHYQLGDILTAQHRIAEAAKEYNKSEPPPDKASAGRGTK